MTRLPWLLALVAAMAFVSRHEANPPAVVVAEKYGVAYAPLGAGGLSAADGKRIVELLESIDGRLKDLQERPAAGPAAVKAPDLLAVVKANCAACHRPGAARGDFAIVNDDKATALRHLSGREQQRVKEAVQSGTMPPDGRRKLTADEKAAFRW